ncbi:Na+/proline symporter, partial [Staphylococcus aureus]|nr:Na+/proline symporter [Staphylococcus aureus]
FIFLGGSLVIIFLGVMNIKGGFGTVFADAIEHKKLITADNWKLNTAAAAIPIILLGNILNNLYQYTASQHVVQRYEA